LITVEPYQELNDLAVIQYGTAEALVQLAKANNLSIDADLIAGSVLSRPSFNRLVSDPILLAPYKLASEENVSVLTYQSVNDLSVQQYGSADALVQACKLNAVAIDSDLVVGSIFKVGLPTRASIKNYYKSKKIKVATEFAESVSGLLNEDGIQFLRNENGSILLP
jgi:hypothetical protein